jgi:hypothetical protein
VSSAAVANGKARNPRACRCRADRSSGTVRGPSPGFFDEGTATNVSFLLGDQYL